MRNKLKKIVGTLLTFALAFTIIGGEAKAVNAATESTYGWKWDNGTQQDGQWTTGAIGGYYKEDTVYLKINVSDFLESDETLSFRLSKANGYEVVTGITLSENADQNPKDFTGTGPGEVLPDGTGAGFSIEKDEAKSTADEHYYTITYIDRVRLAAMGSFTLYIKAKLSADAGKRNSSDIQFGLVDRGTKTIPFAGNGIIADGAITIQKILKDYTGAVKDDEETFQVNLTGPSYPTGQVFNLVNGTDLVIDNLETGKYTVTEIADSEKYDSEINVEDGVVNLNSNKTKATVVITNTEKTRTITATKVWTGGPEKKPEVTLVLRRNGDLVGEKSLVYPVVEATWEDLEARNSLGELYVYTVDEKDDLGYYSKSVDGFTVTNTYTSKVIDISGEKTWVGVGEKPDQIVVNLLMNGNPFDSQVVEEVDGTWKYVFEDVPEKNNLGVDYIYTVEEENVPGFRTTYVKNSNIINITNTTITADVIVTKLGENEEVLSGAEFTLYMDGVKVGEPEVTGTNGKAVFKDIPYGTYTVKETKAPVGYVMSEEIENVKIEDVEDVEITFINEKIMGTVKVKKVDKEDHEVVLAGAKFTIVDNATKVVVYTGTTDVNGMLETELPFGEYTLSEVSAPTDYEKSEETKGINITAHGQVVDILFENEMIEIVDVDPLPVEDEVGTLKIKKVDKETGAALAGVKFRITDKDGDVVFEGLTDVNGMIEEELLVGDYTVTELEALPGYVASAKTETAKIKKDGDVVELTITNRKIYGLLSIKKVDMETGEVLEGARFSIVDKDGKVILEDVTDEEGMLEVWLPKGEYIISETEAPEDYVGTEETWSVKVTADGQVFNLVVENEMIEIEEVSPETLPQTGGIPSAALYILGAFAIFTGLQLTRKRKAV